MRNEKFSKYIYWGVTILIVVLLSASFVMILTHFDYVKTVFDNIEGILAPIIYGAVMAFLLAPVYNHVQSFFERHLASVVPHDNTRRRIAAVFGTILSVLVLLAAVTGLIALMIPELIRSILGIVDSFPTYAANLQRTLEQALRANPEIEERVMRYISQSTVNFQNWVQTHVVPNVYSVVTRMSSGVLSFLTVMKNLLIGLIVMVYLLNMKSTFTTQTKMILYGLLPLKTANKVIEEGRYIHRVFGGFITGKLLDSLIIGLMCFVLLPFMNMPYVMLISVIIGCTNVVPFFGPFIGAVPASVLIMLVSPMKCLYFIVFVFLLQMFDGYILGPKILGDSTGLSSFWVLFSILLFGGLFGFVGMIIAVPSFAVIYKLFTELVVWHLRKKQLSADIREYEDLERIDEQTSSYIKK